MITRFRPKWDEDAVVMESCGDGDYVRHIDHAERIEDLEAQNRQLREPIRGEEAEAILGTDKLPGDATFRIAACGFFDQVMQARAALAVTKEKV